MRWLGLLVIGLAGACQSSASGDLGGQAARLALPAGGRVVQPAGPARVGARVETAACYVGRDATALARELSERLRPDWDELRLIPSDAIPGRFVVVGARDGLGVSGVVDTARGGECAPGEVWVSVGVHPLAATAGGTTAGPTGPRRHGRARLPVVPTPE